MDLVDLLLSELEQDSGLRTPSPPSLSSTTPPPPSLPFSSSSPSCKSPPPPSYSTSPKEALQFPHLILSSTSSKELPAPSLNTSSPPPQLHCLTTNAGKIKQPEKSLVCIIFSGEVPGFVPPSQQQLTLSAIDSSSPMDFLQTGGNVQTFVGLTVSPLKFRSFPVILTPRAESAKDLSCHCCPHQVIITLFHFFTFHQVIITLFHLSLFTFNTMRLILMKEGL